MPFNGTTFPRYPVYASSRTFGDDQGDAFLEEAERIFPWEHVEDTNIVLEYQYSYLAALNRYTMSSTRRYLEPVMNSPVFDALNAISVLGSLSGGINSLANSTQGGGTLGTTRYALWEREDSDRRRDLWCK